MKRGGGVLINGKPNQWVRERKRLGYTDLDNRFADIFPPQTIT
jgi:hypothetical protein